MMEKLSLFLVICLLSMFFIFRKNYVNELNSKINKMIVEIQNLREVKNNLLLEKWNYLELSNIENIFAKDLIKIDEKDFFVLDRV